MSRSLYCSTVLYCVSEILQFEVPLANRISAVLYILYRVLVHVRMPTYCSFR